MMEYKERNMPWNKGLTKELDNRIKGMEGKSNPRYGKKPWNYGLTKETDERVKKYSKSLKGRTVSEETRKKLGKVGLGRIGWNKGLTKEKDKRIKKGAEGTSKTRKRLCSEGKIKTWNMNKTSENDNRILCGENHPLFNNWASREPYGKDFSPELKEQIRKRDNYRCQQCFREQSELFKNTKAGIRRYKLHIHHIDYNKKNNHPNNLISLCIPCHTQTNFKKNDWTEYFQNKIDTYQLK